MKAQELRIGNYFQVNGQTLQVKEIIPERDSSTDARPIPLTEQWLIDFKFKKYIDSYLEINFYNKLIDGNDPQINIRIIDIDCEVCIDGEVYLKHIKYVHQLQNLYFALTGKELTKQ